MHNRRESCEHCDNTSDKDFMQYAVIRREEDLDKYRCVSVHYNRTKPSAFSNRRKDIIHYSGTLNINKR